MYYNFVQSKKSVYQLHLISHKSVPVASRDHMYAQLKAEWVRNIFGSLGFTEVTKFWRLEPYKHGRYLNAPHKSP
jgi:hypothetical protein